MRESLTVLAMLLIVVLTTALVGPYFVDWNGRRGEIETRLSHLLGAKVTVAGPIDVKLLPRPIFRLQQVTVAGLAPRDGTISTARLDMELALTALLRGEILFVDADLTQPKVTLPVGGDRSVVLPHFGAANPDRVSLGHLAVHDGTLVLVGDDGRPTFTATGLEGEGEAESLVGPFKFAGTVDGPGGSLGIRLGTGTYAAQKMRLKTTIDWPGGGPKSEIEGTLSLAATPAGGSMASFEGTFGSTGAVPLAGTATVIPWRVTSRVHAEPGQVEVSALEVRVGADGRALIAAGDGRLDLGDAPVGRLTLKSRQADLTRLAVPADTADGGTPIAPPDVADEVAALKAALLDPDVLSSIPLPVRIDYAVDTVTLGQQTFTDLQGQLALAPSKPVTGTLGLTSPDGSSIALDGTFEPGPAAVFKGRLAAATRDIGRLADGFTPDLPAFAAALKQALPVKAFDFQGIIDLSGVGFAAHDVALTLDRSSFTGTITLTRAVGDDRARLFADLSSDALDLDALPDWRDTAEAASGLDLSVALSARALRLAQSDTGSVTAGRIDLRLTKTGSAVALERLSLADIGGATADVTGRGDDHAAHAEGHIDARRLRDFLGLVHRLVPSALTTQLLARADALSPGLVSFVADAAVEADGSPVLQSLTLDGTAAGTRLDLRLTAAGDATRPAEPRPFDVTLKLEAPEAGALLRQTGLATTATTAIGRAAVALDGRIGGSGPVEGKLSATLGETAITVEGHGDAAAAVAVHATVKSPNVAPLLRALTVAAPALGAVWPLEASADATYADRRLSARAVRGRLAGAAFTGDLAYVVAWADAASTVAASTADPAALPAAALTGALSVDRLSVAVLTSLVLGPLPAPKAGTLWSDAPFAPGLLALPRSDIALRVASLPLNDGETARDAAFTLRVGPGVVTLADLAATLADGRIGGTLALRRDGGSASLGGHVTWNGLAVTSPSFGGRSRGALDLAGSGGSLAALVASLGGTGTVGIDEARLPRLDVNAIGRVLKTSDAATGTVDDLDIKQLVAEELDKGALALGPVVAPVTVAAGVMRGAPIIVKGPSAQSETLASLDLTALLLSLKSTVTLQNVPKDWVGAAPQVSVTWAGPFLAPAREINASSLVNGIAARAIARDQARIEAFQDDIRERAFFARRLRAIEAEQQAARAKAQGDREAQMQKLLDSIPGLVPKSGEGGRPAPKP